MMITQSLAWLLLLVCISAASRGANGLSETYALNISPVSDSDGLIVTTAAHPIDIAGLGLDTDFYSLEVLDIQLLSSLPVWTIHNLHSNSNGFVGESQDRLIACELMRYNNHGELSGDESKSILVGRCQDREHQVTYVIKPNDVGVDTVVVREDREEPEQEDDDDVMYLSWWDIIKTTGPFTLLKELVANSNPLSGRDWEWSRGDDQQQQATEEDIVFIDVMVVWTEAAECENSMLDIGCQLTEETRINMEASTQFMFFQTNIVHANSNTGVRVSLAHMQRDSTNYKEPATKEELLAFLSIPVVDFQLNYIQHLRNQYKADLVMFIYDGAALTDEPWSGGVALGINIPGFPFPTVPLSLLAYTIVSSNAMFGYTPAHELGHLMGCHHDRGSVDDGDGSPVIITNGFACRDWSDTAYGYRSPSGSFHTVMSYSCQTNQCDNYQGNGMCVEIPYFSGNDSYKNGESLGGERNQCREEIRRNRKAIARYR